VLRIEPLKEDQAPSAILELVDGPKDMRFALTAQTLARDRALGKAHNPVTVANADKVTRFREGGAEALEAQVRTFEGMQESGQRGKRDGRKKEVVYPPERSNDYYMGGIRKASKRALEQGR